MVCTKGGSTGGMCEGRREGGGEVAGRGKKRKHQKKNILKQYRKLIAVLPNICSKSKVSKVGICL